MVTALMGMSTPMPMPVGDGTNGRHDFFCSSSVKTSPNNAPMPNDHFIHVSRAIASGASDGAGELLRHDLGETHPALRRGAAQLRMLPTMP